MTTTNENTQVYACWGAILTNKKVQCVSLKVHCVRCHDDNYN